MRVVIYPSALSKIMDFAGIDTKRESAGFLIGKLVGDKLVITDSSLARHVGTAGHVVVDDTEMAEIAEELSEEGMGETIVGWWHTHPSMGAGFMSGTDVATQEKYQRLFPKAVALIVDPVKFLQTGKIEDLDYQCYTVVNKTYKPLETEIAGDTDEVLVTTFRSIRKLRRDLQRVIRKDYEERVSYETVEKAKYPTEGHIIILALWTVALTITITLILLSL